MYLSALNTSYMKASISYILSVTVWYVFIYFSAEFANLFCNGDGTISLPLMLKEKLSCAQCTNCKVRSWKSEADAYFACLVTGASIARAITKSTTGLGFQVQLVVNLKCSQKY